MGRAAGSEGAHVPVPCFRFSRGPHLLGHVDLSFYGHFCNSSGSYLMATYYESGPELGRGFTEMSRLGS